MKYSYLLLAFVIISCSNNKNSSNADIAADTTTVASTKEPVVKEIPTEKKVVAQDNASQEEDVKRAFRSLVNSINNTDGKNINSTMALLDDYYVFRGEDKNGNEKRLKKQFARFQFKITDLTINRVEASCNLAYLIASYKKSLIGRESGNVAVDKRDKVGLFIMKKDSENQWKLLIQKTDDGFAQWFYMPEKK